MVDSMKIKLWLIEEQDCFDEGGVFVMKNGVRRL